jgi:mannose-1-phosphate guanylyltransferase
MRALILSAGLGERLRPVTEKKAKPAVEFLNVPMLAYPYHWMSGFDLSDLVLNTHYLPESVQAAARQVVDPNTHLHFTFEPKILGSGGGIWNARKHLQWDDDFLIANGDSVALFEEADTLEQMMKFHRQKDALATLLVCPLEGVGTRLPGVWMDAYGEVTNFGKAAKKDYLTCYHYASFMILSKRIWNYLPDGESNILYEILEPQIAKGEKVYGFKREDIQWFETGNAKDYLAATKTCLDLLGGAGSAPMASNLKAFLKRYTPDSAFLKETGSLVSGLAETAAEAALKGAVIGRGARVLAGALVEDSVLLPGSKVEAGATVRGQIVIS